MKVGRLVRKTLHCMRRVQVGDLVQGDGGRDGESR